MKYPFGYTPQEFERLQKQHAVWLTRTQEHLDAGDVKAGDVVLDLGCGPGFVSEELAKRGVRVLASDQNQHSLDYLAEREISGIEIIPACDASELPPLDPAPTAVYVRWMLCYLGASRAEAALRRLSAQKILVHDYIDYRTARLEPGSAVVEYVIDSFYRTMKDADIGLALPGILDRCGFEITWQRVVQMHIRPDDPAWSWPDEFFRLHVPSLRHSDEFLRHWNVASQNSGALFHTWSVLQLVAVRK